MFVTKLWGNSNPASYAVATGVELFPDTDKVVCRVDAEDVFSVSVAPDTCELPDIMLWSQRQLEKNKHARNAYFC
jgi:hypothetical protein